MPDTLVLSEALRGCPDSPQTVPSTSGALGGLDSLGISTRSSMSPAGSDPSPGYRAVSLGKFAASESPKTMQQRGHERIFPVPTSVAPAETLEASLLAADAATAIGT